MTLTGELSRQRLRRSAVPEIMVGALQNLNGSRDLATPLSGMVCYTRAITCYRQPTKFEASISAHYKDMKGDSKCRKWGGLG